jgi:hypothetical protein
VITERRNSDDHGTCACLASRHAEAPQITPIRAGSKFRHVGSTEVTSSGVVCEDGAA